MSNTPARTRMALLLLLCFGNLQDSRALVLPRHHHNHRLSSYADAAGSAAKAGIRSASRRPATLTTLSLFSSSTTNDNSKEDWRSGGSNPSQQRRKRDILLGPFRSSSSRSSASRSSLLILQAAQKNDNEETSDDNKSEKSIDENSKKESAFAFFTELKEKWDTNVSAIQQAVPEPILKVLQWISDAWNNVKWLLVSFTAGAVLSVTALIVPLYDSVQTVTQPVTLFETILSDLEQAYVEPVDTNKLFETGVSAMLRSLDPYTEFEGIQEAQDMTESIEGRYGGVGLVIAGIPNSAKPKAAAAKPAAMETAAPASSSNIAPDQPLPPTTDALTTPISNSNPVSPKTAATSVTLDDELDDGLDMDDDDDDYQTRRDTRRRLQLAKDKGIRVVSAFEGYAFDYGMRVGDKLVAVDDVKIESATTTIEDVRNTLRGEPGTLVTIQFERDGVEGIQSVTMPRSVVRIRDVKLATLLGDPRDGIGYIQLAGFASDAGREMRQAIQYLQRAAEDASNGEQTLQGLVLDLRGNPGGLLTSAVDVASQLVPKGSDIVSAKGRGFPGLIYRSRVDPILDTSQTKLAVLVNGNTASAAEIVSGAVQDLDVGVIVGQDRTFGKGLVQNVEELPYNTALKFTVAKYYTPSGRCIQGVKYTEGGGLKSESDGRYVASKISEKDRGTFYTRTGRIVRDGGGIEADYKVPSQKASALEVTLLRSGVFNDFAAEWSKKHELTNNFSVDEDTYKSFQAFVNEKQKSGDLQLEVIYDKPLADLKKALKASGYKGSEKSVEQLQARIIRDIQSDFEKYRNDIKEDISQNILARYLPESMLIERGVQKDAQVEAAVKLLSQRSTFDKLLAKGSAMERNPGGLTADGSSTGSSMNVAQGDAPKDSTIEGFRSTIAW